jgi:hypothetical protein
LEGVFAVAFNWLVDAIAAAVMAACLMNSRRLMKFLLDEKGLKWELERT